MLPNINEPQPDGWGIYFIKSKAPHKLHDASSLYIFSISFAHLAP